MGDEFPASRSHDACFAVYRIYVGIQTPGTVIGASVIRVAQPEHTTETVQLDRGAYNVFRYVPGDPAFAANPRAIIIFGSGDGGYTGLEDRVFCR